jgi:hypothetical protein
VGYRVISIPTDEVVLIKKEGENTVHPVRLGEKLPSGATLLNIDIQNGRMRTSQGMISMQP